MKNNTIYTLLLLMIFGTSLLAQKSSDLLWGFDERKLVETKWKYNYTLQKETNTILHKADKDYQYYLYFRYDKTFQQYLNGQFSGGSWQLNGKTLSYKFRDIDSFEIAVLNKGNLVIEFQQSNALGKYQYHFSRVSSDKSPFIKPAYELPDVIVETKAQKRAKRKSWLRLLFTRKKKNKERINLVGNGKYISIELAGGGYYGGINPVIRDYIHIKSNGRLIKEFKSKKGGLQVHKAYISRIELEQFMEYVQAQGFFEMERIYDCDDLFCAKRKTKSPKPIPLRLVIAYGNKRKIVTVTIWGLDKNKVNYVPHPKGLDNIIYAIQEMANRQ
ncbi:MAG TPA: hypothetical protein ENK85_03060 [Saprospiraceae bacterium]|nr:hypothetical protein [Saprospiraceae bacterium]